MCLAIPGKIVKIEGDYAKVDFGGVTKKVGISLVMLKRVNTLLFTRDMQLKFLIKPKQKNV